MEKNDVEKFIKECQKDGYTAKKAVQKLNKVQIAELKAELKVKSIHKDKIIVILVPYLTAALAVLSLISDMEGADKNNVGFIGLIFLVIFAVAMLIYMWNRTTKEPAIERARSFLEDFSGK